MAAAGTAGSRTEPETTGDLFAGKYRLLRMLGKGGMGEVWLAEEEGPRNFRRRVAVKKLLARTDIDEYAQESFFSEAQVIARLDHPNIVRLIELGVAEDTVFLVLDYVDGPSLDRLIKKGGGPLSPLATAYVGREIARALEAVHALCDDHGQSYCVVHRDISPSNVLISRDGRVRLADFGIAKISGLGAEKTATGVFKGKLQYMPPEQARGEPFDGRADIFSLGITLQEALIGRRLRKAETQTQMMIQVATRPVPRLRDRLPDVPAAIADAIDHAAEFDLGRRTQDAGRLAADLDHALRSISPAAEQEARDEIRRRVEATLVALGEPVSGSHVRGQITGHTGRGPSAPPTPTGQEVTSTGRSRQAGREPAGISEVHTREPTSAPPTRPSPVMTYDPDPPDQGPPSSRSAPTVLERPPARHPPETSEPAARPSPADATRPLASGPTRRAPIVALLALLALVVGAIAGVVYWGVILPSGKVPGSTSPSAPAAPDPGSTSGLRVAASAPSAADPSAESATPAETASAPIAGADETPPASGTPHRQTRPGTPHGAPPSPRPASTPTSTAAAVDASAPGTLQVVVLPWADVIVDGRSAGTTPLAPISLPPGPHTVVLRNAELGARRTVPVVIKPGAPASIRVDLRRTEKP